MLQFFLNDEHCYCLCANFFVCIYTDPKELKRQRDREYYARNKDDILKRRRDARQNNGTPKTLPNDEQSVPHTPLAMTQSKNNLLLLAYVSLFR